MADGYWFHLLEDKAAAYLLNVEQGHNPPVVHCCVIDPTLLSDCGQVGTADPIVIKAVDGHSNAGVFVFPSGVSSGSTTTELLTGTSMSLEDVIAKLNEGDYSKILVEEFVSNGGALPTEYKVHVFNGVVGAIDIVYNRGSGCDCYASIDADCARLDKYGYVYMVLQCILAAVSFPRSFLI
ncbi:MAG: hypothetical protein AAGJ35_08245 [Myxococcota bacterium]